MHLPRKILHAGRVILLETAGIARELQVREKK